MRYRIITLAGFAVVVAAACGDTTSATPEPTTIATQTSSPSSSTTSPSSTTSTTVVSVEIPKLTLGGITLLDTEFADGTPVFYAVVVPADFDPAIEYPVFLALPPGAQDAGLTFNVTEGWYMAEALARGWVVISPAAPENVLWFQGSEQYIEEFLDHTLSWLNPEEGLIHIGGVSNGGRSTFKILSMLPNRFASVTVYPGYPAGGAETDALANVGDIPFTLWVGGADTPWITPMEATRDELSSLGRDVTYLVFEGAPHVIPDLTDGVEIFDVLEAARP